MRISTSLLRPLIASLLAICAAPLLAYGQADNLSISSWGTANGLPESVVNDVATEPGRGVWVATNGGLCLFNGTSCEPWQNGSGADMPRSFNILLLAHDRTLWVGTEGRGLLHISGSRYEVFDARNGLNDNYVRALFEDHEHHLWVGTDEGLFKMEGRRFSRIPLDMHGTPKYIHAITEDRSHHLFAGGASLFEIDGQQISTVELPRTPLGTQIKSLLISRRDRLIVGTTDGAFEQVVGAFRRLPVPQVDVESLHQSSDGVFWAGTISGGLWSFMEDSKSSVEIKRGDLLHTVTSSIAEDTGGRLWLGTQNGLIRIETADVHLVPFPVSGVDCETLAVTPQGSVRLVNSSVFDLTSSSPREIRPSLPRNLRILNVHYSPDRSIWVGTTGAGLFHILPNGRQEHYSTKSSPRISADFLHGITEGTNGDIWVASSFGADRITKSRVESFSVGNGLPNRNVRFLLKGRDGCMWIGTDGGLATYCRGRFVDSLPDLVTKGQAISSIAEDGNGTLWVGTFEHGLYAFAGSDFRHFTASDGLFGNSICSILADNDGNLWVSTPDILYSFPLAHAVVRNEAKDFLIARPSILPTIAEGLSFTRWRFPSAAVDANGTVWFATDHGPVFVPRVSRVQKTSTEIPIPVIQSVRADGSFLPGADLLRLHARPSSVIITLDINFLGRPREALIIYRLKGIDEGWRILSASRQVEYLNLSPGKYEFEAVGYSRTQHGDSRRAHCWLLIPTVWYRTRWFISSLALFIAIIVFSGYFLRIRQLRSRFKLVLEERARVAREMHDTLLQGCNGVAMLLEAESSSRSPGETSEWLDAARIQLRATLADARDALWNLRQSECDAAHFGESLARISEQSSKMFGIPVVLCHEGKLPSVASNSAHELTMIVREAVTNAALHGSPRQIAVNTSVRDRSLQIEICDDGIGFDVESVLHSNTEHFGIRSMYERARTIAADIQIISGSGRGTIVRVICDISSNSNGPSSNSRL